MIELSFILLHFLLFFLVYQISGKKIMNPAALFSLVWFTILLLHFIFKLTLLPDLFPLSISTFLIFFVGTIFFCLGSFMQLIFWQHEKANSLNTKISILKINLKLRLVLLLIILVGLPFYINAAYRVFLSSNIDNFFVGLRTELAYGDENIGPLMYLVSFSYVVFGINLYAYFRNRNRSNLIILVANLIITLTYAVFITGRGMFLELLLLYMGMAFLLNKSFSFKKITYFFLIFLLLFVIIGIMYGKGGSSEDSFQENIRPAAEITAVYLVSPVNALDWETHHQFQITYNGNNSFRFFIKIGQQLNLVTNAKVEEILQPFVFIPYPTNVYTVYSPYIKDFGKGFAWLMMFIFGFIHSFIYFKALFRKNIRYSLYFSFSLFPLFMSFYQDQYLSLISSWIQIIVYTELILFINKMFQYKFRGSRPNRTKTPIIL